MEVSKWGLKIGDQVHIRRSDGRVHPAVVSGFNEATESVTVEWFENDETKGKELDIRHLAALNDFVAAAMQKSQNGAAAAASAAPPAAAAPARREPTSVSARGRRAPKASEKNEKGDRGDKGEKKKPVRRASDPQRKRDKSKVVDDIRKMEEQRAARRQQANHAREAENKKYEGKQDKATRQFAGMIEDFKEGLDVKHLARDQTPQPSKITVCVRKRPMARKELQSGEIDVITIPDGCTTLIHEPKVKVDLTKYLDNHKLLFDYAFDETSDNELVYNFTAKPLVETIFENGMATCFAYGQTGSGKTYTMGGDFAQGARQNASNGIYAMSARDVFRLNSTRYADKNLSVSISFFEIYGGKVFDLLNKQKRLRVLEDGKQQVQVVGLSEKVVLTLDDVLQLLTLGSKSRAQGTTSANAHSSRSHAVFQIILRLPGRQKKLCGKFSLIDLAGNERGADTAHADRQTRIEGAEINKSLLALKECIRALGRKGTHTPFRASKLTQVLRDSFVGKHARTCMIAMVSPSKSSCEHSLNTLRYADRVKELAPNKKHNMPALVDDDADDDEEEVQELEKSLADRDLKLLHMSLRNRGEHNGSDDMFNFQQAAHEVVEAEERIVEEHRAVIQFDREMLAEEEKLLDDVDRVDYDVEEYASRLEQILSHKIEKMNNLRANLNNFRKQLQREEATSKNVKLRHV